MFCFSCANHASTNLKKVLSWNLRNLWKNAVSIFFRLSWLFKREKPVFRKAFFCKTKTDYAFKLRVQDFATGQNFSFNQYPKQKSFAFFLGKVILKPTENFFPVVCISLCKHWRGWENAPQLCKPSTSSRVWVTVSNSPNPSRVYIRLCKHRKRFLLLSSSTPPKREP